MACHNHDTQVESYHDDRTNEQSSRHRQWEYRRLVCCLLSIYLMATEANNVASMTFSPYLKRIYKSGVPPALQRMGSIYRKLFPIFI